MRIHIDIFIYCWPALAAHNYANRFIYIHLLLCKRYIRWARRGSRRASCLFRFKNQIEYSFQIEASRVDRLRIKLKVRIFHFDAIQIPCEKRNSLPISMLWTLQWIARTSMKNLQRAFQPLQIAPAQNSRFRSNLLLLWRILKISKRTRIFLRGFCILFFGNINKCASIQRIQCAKCVQRQNAVCLDSHQEN